MLQHVLDVQGSQVAYLLVGPNPYLECFLLEPRWRLYMWEDTIQTFSHVSSSCGFFSLSQYCTMSQHQQHLVWPVRGLQNYGLEFSILISKLKKIAKISEQRMLCQLHPRGRHISFCFCQYKQSSLFCFLEGRSCITFLQIGTKMKRLTGSI